MSINLSDRPVTSPATAPEAVAVEKVNRVPPARKLRFRLVENNDEISEKPREKRFYDVVQPVLRKQPIFGFGSSELFSYKIREATPAELINRLSAFVLFCDENKDTLSPDALLGLDVLQEFVISATLVESLRKD